MNLKEYIEFVSVYVGRKGTLHMGNNEMMSRERFTLGHVWWLATGQMVLNQCDVYALQSLLGRAPVIVFLPFACISGKSRQLDMPLVSLSSHDVCMYLQGQRKWNPASPFHLKGWDSGQLHEEQWLEGVIGMVAILWPPLWWRQGNWEQPSWYLHWPKGGATRAHLWPWCGTLAAWEGWEISWCSLPEGSQKGLTT